MRGHGGPVSGGNGLTRVRFLKRKEFFKFLPLIRTGLDGPRDDLLSNI